MMISCFHAHAPCLAFPRLVVCGYSGSAGKVVKRLDIPEFDNIILAGKQADDKKLRAQYETPVVLVLSVFNVRFSSFCFIASNTHHRALTAFQRTEPSALSSLQWL
jgi:hypothetical protein